MNTALTLDPEPFVHGAPHAREALTTGAGLDS